MNFLRVPFIGFSRSALRAGLSVSALIMEMKTLMEIVIPN